MQQTTRFSSDWDAPIAPGAFPVRLRSTRPRIVEIPPVVEIPVEQALLSLGEPTSPAELGHRLGAALAMIWSNIDYSNLFVAEASGTLRSVCDSPEAAGSRSPFHAHSDKTKVADFLPIRPVRAAGDAARCLGPAMSVPVFSSSSHEGFVLVQRSAGSPDFTASDLEALTAFASGVGDLLPRARTHARKSISKWRDQDMVSAREVQRALLPKSLQTNSAGIRVVAEYLPAFAVGGDFYDLIDLGAGRLVATMGDVSGKGVTAALTMSRLAGEIRRLASETDGPAHLLTQLNMSPPARMHDDRFATVVCVRLDMPTRRWVVANAGHVLPILRRKDGEVKLIGRPSCLPIGINSSTQYQEEGHRADPGDILILATDGAFEVLSGAHVACSTIGHCKLTAIVEDGPHDVAELSRRLVAAVDAKSGERDDVAMLGLQIPG